MAKNNNKKQQNFFDQQVQKLGTGWLYMTNTDQVRKNALRVFKDIAFGNIDPHEDAKYFESSDFTYNLKVAADDNAMYSWACYVGLSNYPGLNPDMQRVARVQYDCYVAFSIVSTFLNNILNCMSQGGVSYIPALLMQLETALGPYKYNFNGYFITLPRDNDRRVRVPRREIGGNGYDQRVNNENQGQFWESDDQDCM